MAFAKAKTSTWVDAESCSALCLLILSDRRCGSIAAGPQRLPRPSLPSTLYSEHIAPFLRFEAPLPNMLYAIGGRNRRRGPVNSVEMLDTWNGRWVPCPPMPRRRAGGAAAALPDGRLLVVGGYDERGIAEGLLAACDIYDPMMECWAEGEPLRRARWGHGCAALAGKVFAVGGCSLQLQAHAQEAFMETLKSCEVYDPATDHWEPSAPLQVARSGSRVVALGDRRLATVGGCDDVFGRAETQATVEIFDKLIGHWELLVPRLVHPRTSAAVAAIDDRRFFVAGGAPSQLSVEVYCTPAPFAVGIGACRGVAAQGGDGVGGLAPPMRIAGASCSGSAAEAAEGLATHQEDDIAAKLLSHSVVADMVEGRMGCQAVVMHLPREGGRHPVCDSECVVVVGGERCDDHGAGASFLAPRVRQLCSVAAYDLKTCRWRDSTAVPSMAVPRTTVALCLGMGRVSGARLTA
mmetsp:Transcript_8613/g.22256  ORF Transcript_8613/g.22256 Transcript_8613/m.22256 type:complete len:464 (-) Transcript_8613:195-1586(-)